MQLPEKFKWLDDIGQLPKLVSLALSYIGLREYPGSANNPVIMDMAKGLGIEDIYVDDSKQAWCAVFMFHLLRMAKKPYPPIGNDIYNYLRAFSFTRYGNPVNLEDAVLGDIVVIKRDGGYHVFILLAFTNEGNIIGIGGNQKNAVTISEFDKERVIAVRRYYSIGAPESAKRYVVNSMGSVSTNES